METDIQKAQRTAAQKRKATGLPDDSKELPSSLCMSKDEILMGSLSAEEARSRMLVGLLTEARAQVERAKKELLELATLREANKEQSKTIAVMRRRELAMLREAEMKAIEREEYESALVASMRIITEEVRKVRRTFK